jgi:hypothetical protein
MRTSADIVAGQQLAGKGPMTRGRLGGINRAGATDLAGNVKEWCWNAAGTKRYILGGGWNEPVYMFTDADAQSPFARPATHGFRCIKVDRPEDVHGRARERRRVPIAGSARREAGQRPRLRGLAQPVSFDHGDLQAKVESTDDASPEWRVEKVSYAAAYGTSVFPRTCIYRRT